MQMHRHLGQLLRSRCVGIERATSRLRRLETFRAYSSLSDELRQHVKDASLLRSESYVGGKWVTAQDGSELEVLNPATGQKLASMANLKGAETHAAIEEASAAFPAWSTRPGKERAAVLQRWYQEVLSARDDIAALMTLESGKPLAESRSEFDLGAESISWFSEEAKRVCGDILASPSPSSRFLVMKQPVGVVGAVTPWNFPFSMITRKVAPALAAGCTVVLKPSELTPLTALALAVLAERAGIPKGVLNIVVGDAQPIGDALVESDLVRKIGFTGSTAVGKRLMAGSAPTLKRVSLELGGNAPFIVFQDADIEKAARDVVASSYRNAGQTCICTNRAFVHSSVYDAFAEAVADRVSKLKLGDGMEAGVSHGPLITQRAVEGVAAKVDDAVERGAKVILGGRKPQWGAGSPLEGGSFFEPTLLTGATPDMRVFREEIFGPVTPLFKFDSDQEAIALANSTEYGLAAYFYTQDLSRAWRAAEALQYGMVGVNEVAITTEVAPFGGVKHSGMGREHSKYGLDEFLSLKTVCMGLGTKL